MPQVLSSSRRAKDFEFRPKVLHLASEPVSQPVEGFARNARTPRRTSADKEVTCCLSAEESPLLALSRVVDRPRAGVWGVHGVAYLSDALPELPPAAADDIRIIIGPSSRPLLNGSIRSLLFAAAHTCKRGMIIDR